MGRSRRLSARRSESSFMAGLVENDEPQRLLVGGGAGERPFYGELPTNVLVDASSTGDSNRKWRLEVGFALELDLTVLENQGPMAQHVEPAGGDRDVNAIQHAAIHPLAVGIVDRGLDHLVTRAITLRSD